MHPLVNIAIRAARSAGDLIVRYLDRLDTVNVTEKGSNDLVTEVDRRAEERIVSTIHKAYPNHAILAEESGASRGSECEWIIDPLDGTHNFVHGFPHFAVSIAARIRGRIEHGVVFDPIRHELFVASRGAGARRDDHRIRVSGRAGLNGALLGTGFPQRDLTHLEEYLDTMRVLVPGTRGVRRAGAAALDLAYVAAGRLDGFWEFGLAPWDIAAGALLVREAGGMVTDARGGEDYLASGDVVTGAPKTHREMLVRMRPVLVAR